MCCLCVWQRERYTLCGVTLTKLGFNTQILISDTHTLKQKAYNVRLLDGKQLLLCSCIRRHRALHQLKPWTLWSQPRLLTAGGCERNVLLWLAGTINQRASGSGEDTVSRFGATDTWGLIKLNLSELSTYYSAMKLKRPKVNVGCLVLLTPLA